MGSNITADATRRDSTAAVRQRVNDRLSIFGAVSVRRVPPCLFCTVYSAVQVECIDLCVASVMPSVFSCSYLHLYSFTFKIDFSMYSQRSPPGQNALSLGLAWLPKTAQRLVCHSMAFEIVRMSFLHCPSNASCHPSVQ